MRSNIPGRNNSAGIPTRLLTVAAVWLLSGYAACQADIILMDTSPAYAQDFDGLASSGTSSTLPDGWFLSESGSGGNTSYAAGTGSSNTGNTYSFGTAGSVERALGSLRTGTVIPSFGVRLQVGGPLPLQSLQVSYTGEHWRLGATGRLDQLDFQYSLDATSLTTGAWTDFDLLDFVSPSSAGSAGLRDGNLPASRQSLSGTLTGFSLSAGSSVWLRWQDADASGADDGLAIDDLAVTGTFQAASVPEPGCAVLLAAMGGCGVLYGSGTRRSARRPSATA